MVRWRQILGRTYTSVKQVMSVLLFTPRNLSKLRATHAACVGAYFEKSYIEQKQASTRRIICIRLRDKQTVLLFSENQLKVPL
jgi:hypothetical protein